MRYSLWDLSYSVNRHTALTAQPLFESQNPDTKNFPTEHTEVTGHMKISFTKRYRD
jgi:hypothetical protein